MPSLRIIPELEKEIGKPVISAAVCTVFSILKSLNLSTSVPNGGRLLTGDY
jgi:maleate isomerase